MLSIVTVIALTTSDVIFKEDMNAATTWGDIFSAVYKFATIRFRANCYIVASWGLSLWNSIDYYFKGFLLY
jgi:hypothetical protein